MGKSVDISRTKRIRKLDRRLREKGGLYSVDIFKAGEAARINFLHRYIEKPVAYCQLTGESQNRGRGFQSRLEDLIPVFVYKVQEADTDFIHSEPNPKCLKQIRGLYEFVRAELEFRYFTIESSIELDSESGKALEKANSILELRHAFLATEYIQDNGFHLDRSTRSAIAEIRSYCRRPLTQSPDQDNIVHVDAVVFDDAELDDSGFDYALKRFNSLFNRSARRLRDNPAEALSMLPRLRSAYFQTTGHLLFDNYLSVLGGRLDLPDCNVKNQAQILAMNYIQTFSMDA